MTSISRANNIYMQNKGIALCCTTQFNENLFVLFSIYFLMYLYIYIYNKSVRLFLVLFILYVIHIMAGNNCVIMMYRIMHYVSTTNINTISPNRLIQCYIVSTVLTLLKIYWEYAVILSDIECEGKGHQ